MKKIFIFLAIGMLMVSCNKLLTESPKYTINSTNAFNSTTTAQMALDGCYGYLISWNAYGQAYFELTLGGSGESWALRNGSDQDQLASLNVLNSNGTLGQVWTGMYSTIAQCNAFIENVDKGSLSDSLKNFYAAQAHFIRALCYYNLAGIWGDVPLRISASSVDSLNMPRTPKATVYQQVSADWKFAAQYLPAADNSADQTLSVPTKYAAYAYLAKLYWLLGSNDNTSSSPNWALAKVYGDSVLNASAYSLEPKFSNLFIDGTNNSKEIIFKLNVSTNLSGMGSRISWLFAPSSSTTGISWGRFKPLKSLYDLFKGTYPNDPRLATTFETSYKGSNGTAAVATQAYPNISYKVGSTTYIDSVHYALLANPTNPTIAEITSQDSRLVTTFTATNGANEGWPYYYKYVDPTATAQLGNKQILVYRYADFLLLMADVYNELGQTTTAVSLINQVLTRARTSVSPAAADPQNIAASITRDSLRTRIFNERLFELVGEPDMFFDTRRRGTGYFGIVLQRNNSHNITYTDATNPALSATLTYKDRVFDNTVNVSGDSSFLKKNMLLPIPVIELNTNSDITQADQNYGY